MSQSSAIAAALMIAFVVFVTVRGELPCYLGVLGIASASRCNVPGGIAGVGLVSALTGEPIAVGGTGGVPGIVITPPSINV